MSQDPFSKLDSSGTDFTPTIHHDTYDYISPEQFDLKDRAVFVTGASKGIGEATAISYARAGASMIAIGARSSMTELEQKMKDAAKKAGKSEPKVLSIRMDVTDKNSVEDAVKKVEQDFGRLDILINNAGYLEKFARIAESDPDDWMRVYQVNVIGPYLVARATIPLLIKTQNGLKTILNVSSIGAHVLMPGASGYQTGKLALIRLSEFITREYYKDGVRCFATHPGGIMTELAKGMPENYHEMLNDTPELAADSFVWMTAERREWLASRYISCNWDMKELLEKKEKIEKGDLLKVRLAVGME